MSSFLRRLFLCLSFCVRLSLLLLSRYDTANEYITITRSSKNNIKIVIFTFLIYVLNIVKTRFFFWTHLFYSGIRI